MLTRDSLVLGRTPSTAGTFRKKFQKNSAKTPETLSSIGIKKSTQTFFVQSFSRTLRAMDVRAENRGRPHQKVRFSAAPVMGKKLFDPTASGRKGQECPREIRTEKFMFVLFFLP